MDRRDFIRAGAGFGAVLLGVRAAAGRPAGEPELVWSADGPWPPFLTPAEQFYNAAHADRPLHQLAPEEWQLQIDGAVARPLTLGWDDLKRVAARAGVEVVATLQCVDDRPGQPPLMSQGLWTGVPLKEVLRLAEPLPSARRVLSQGRDRKGSRPALRSNLPLAAIEAGNPAPPLLVWGLNGEPLPLERGQPVRLLAPGRFGFKSIKWLERTHVSEHDGPLGNYETQRRAYDDEARLRTKPRFFRPRGLRVWGRDFWIAGYAVVGPEGLAAVELKVEDGDWQPVELAADRDVRQAWPEGAQPPVPGEHPHHFTWLPWRLAWTDVRAGRYRLRCRAIDSAGRVTPEEDSRWQDGITAQDTLLLEVRN